MENIFIPKKEESEGKVLLGISASDLRATVRSMLRKLGAYSISEVSDGQSVLRHLRNQAEGEIFLIMDWDMALASGVDVAREIRSDKQLENIPMIILAGEPTAENIGLAGEIGVNGCIVKPFTPNTLITKFLKIIHGRANPPDHILLLKKGEEHEANGEYEDALKNYQASSSIKKSARVMVHIGDIHKKEENYFDAKDAYEEALDTNPLYVKAYAQASQLAVRMGDKSAALEYLAKASQISPYNSDRQLDLGNLYLESGDRRSAEEAFDEAVRLDPAKAAEVGDKYLELGNAEKSEECYRKLLKTSDNLQSYNQLGIALRRQGKWEDAIVEYQKAVKAFPDDGALHFNMGKAYLDGDDLYRAKDSFRQAVRLDPSLEEAKKELNKLGMF